MPLTIPHWAWLVAAFLLFFGSIALSVYGFRIPVSNYQSRGPDSFKNPQFELVSRQEFENEIIEIDGKRFFECTFKNVKLMYHGTAPSEITPKSVIEKGTVILVTDNPVVSFGLQIYQFLTSGPNAEITDGKNSQTYKKQPILEPPTLRERIIKKCDELSSFLSKHGPLPHPKRQPGEVEEEYVARQIRERIKFRDDLGADFRLTFRDSIHLLRDEIQVRRITFDQSINDDLARSQSVTCDPKYVEAVRAKLWAAAINAA